MNKPSTGWHLLEARPDWITATAKRGFNANALYDLGISELEHEFDSGQKLTPWSFHGYDGFASGNIRVGSGLNGSIVVATQDAAFRDASTLARVADHWSRVDYCVTAWDESSAADPVNDVWNNWHWRSDPSKSPVELTKIESISGGSTLYMGKRASSKFVRIYNKHKESPHEYVPGCWRWELELKREASELQQQRWRTKPLHEPDMANVIATYLKTFDVASPWPSSVDPLPQGRFHREKDVDRTLRWFETQVSGAVDFAVQALGKERVLESLNLAFRPGDGSRPTSVADEQRSVSE